MNPRSPRSLENTREVKNLDSIPQEGLYHYFNPKEHPQVKELLELAKPIFKMQLKEASQLKGRVISEVIEGNPPLFDLMIKFTDGSYCILTIERPAFTRDDEMVRIREEELDYEEKYSYGLINDEEYERLFKEASENFDQCRKERDLIELKRLREKYPND